MLQKHQKQSLWIVFDKSRQTINELREIIREEPSPWRMRINAGAGKLLGDLYMSIERIIRLFIEDVFGEKIVKDESWHTRLIESGKAKGLLPECIGEVMRQMKNFRHRMIHGYGIEMDEEKLRVAIPEAIAAYEKVEAHIRAKFPELDEKLPAAESADNR
ncbi:DUF86 domain-containing protein [Synergistaceae bacterium OttesenSCG-928-I11]|nr:DUF86 domain-containing protein [Synergistaceae bacterium OttesenSCG-928-I11]